MLQPTLSSKMSISVLSVAVLSMAAKRLWRRHFMKLLRKKRSFMRRPGVRSSKTLLFKILMLWDCCKMKRTEVFNNKLDFIPFELLDSDQEGRRRASLCLYRCYCFSCRNKATSLSIIDQIFDSNIYSKSLLNPLRPEPILLSSPITFNSFLTANC